MWFMVLLAVVFFGLWWIEKGEDEHIDGWFRWR